jgi:ABC-2 type transport system permease protein
MTGNPESRPSAAARGGPSDIEGQTPKSKPQSFIGATLRVFELSLGQMLWSRRTIFMALVVAAPVLLAIVARIVQGAGIAPIRINGARVGGAGIFGMIIWLLYLRFIVPVLGVFYGTALIADEIDDKTITYLFTRPIPRGAVLLGKYLAYLVCTVFVVLPSVMVVYFLLVPFGEISGSFGALMKDLGILGLGLACYGALFALVGAIFRRPLVVGLVFVFGWEQVALLLPGYLRQFTLAHYLQALVPHAMPANETLSLFQAVFRDVPSTLVSLFWLSLALIVALALAARAVGRREYVLEQ